MPASRAGAHLQKIRLRAFEEQQTVHSGTVRSARKPACVFSWSIASAAESCAFESRLGQLRTTQDSKTAARQITHELTCEDHELTERSEAELVVCR